MKFLRKLMFTKEEYLIQNSVLETIKTDGYNDLFVSIVGPISIELEPYIHKGTTTLKEEYLFLPVVDYINGFVISGLRISKNGEMYDKERFHKLKEAFLVKILGLDFYIVFNNNGFLDRGCEASQEHLEGDIEARARYYGASKNVNGGLPDLGGIMKREILSERIRNAHNK